MTPRWTDTLLQRAGIYWTMGEPVPSDLYMEMTNAGLNVDIEEAHYYSQKI